ncbi:ATP-grasp domain-containing protein [Methanocalculus sp.]|uniref:carboxylate--amine ligase n=1 Tax=Methanocalculus sp. TaxID=2004547 RepID=UPI002625E853|nr:ATP-grasp domain-containing protein [Methanocalculus sp.]
MPLDEKLIAILAQKKTDLKCQLPFSDFSVLSKVMNKASLMEHAIENKVSCPKTYFVESVDDINRIKNEIEYPVTIKPTRMSGGNGITFVYESDKLRDAYDSVLRRYGPSIIQEKIPFFEKYTVGCILNRDSKVRRVCVLKEARNYPIETGPACCIETVHQPDVLKISIKLLESLDYYGIADVDVIIDERDGKPKIVEINPRFWASMQAALTAGVDFPYLLYRMVNEGDLDFSLDYKVGIRCRNIIFNDMRHLISVLRGDHNRAYKLEVLLEFIKFHQDDAYYIFCLEDIKPFLAFVPQKIYRSIITKAIVNNDILNEESGEYYLS